MTDADMIKFRKEVLGDPIDRLVIYFKCQKLPKCAGKCTDPFCVLYKLETEKDGTGTTITKEIKVGRTEVRKHELDPEFVWAIERDIHFEVANNYRVKVYHAKSEDKKTHDDEQQHELIGKEDFELKDLFNDVDHKLSFKIDCA